MADKVTARLGAVQETLFIPLAARARETRKRRPVLRDPKAAEIVASVHFDTAKYDQGGSGLVSVLRTGQRRTGQPVKELALPCSGVGHGVLVTGGGRGPVQGHLRWLGLPPDQPGRERGGG